MRARPAATATAALFAALVPALLHVADRALAGPMMAAAPAAANPAPPSPTSPPIRGFTAEAAARESALEARLRSLTDRESIRRWHQYLTAEPHVAGSPRNLHLAEWMAEQWRAQGIEDVVIRRYDVLSSAPKSVRVEMVAPERYVPTLREDPIHEDPTSANPAVSGGWLSFSASGDVTAPAIYANSGNPADYDLLRRNGIDPKGKVVIVRYSNPYSYRGFKALTAQRATKMRVQGDA